HDPVGKLDACEPNGGKQGTRHVARVAGRGLKRGQDKDLLHTGKQLTASSIPICEYANIKLQTTRSGSVIYAAVRRITPASQRICWPEAVRAGEGAISAHRSHARMLPACAPGIPPRSSNASSKKMTRPDGEIRAGRFDRRRGSGGRERRSGAVTRGL